jgi:FG-GAP repeat
LPTVVDLSSLGSAGFIIQGDSGSDLAGASVSSAGDINGDGFDDLIVGAPSTPAGHEGDAYVLFGKAGGFGTIDLTGLESRPADGFVIQRYGAYGLLGASVSSAGDINGDGFDDLIVGEPNGQDQQYSIPGNAYVIFGKATPFGTVDVGTMTAADGFAIVGDMLFDRAGASVSGAGDVNGDGFDDIIVGAPGGDDGGYGAGEAYVIFGKAGGFAAIDLGALAPADGFVIQGDASDAAGLSVSSAGDVNGDGFDDLIFGAQSSTGGERKVDHR